MADVGYCTVDDVRRALRKNGLPGDASQDRDIVLDAITGQTEWLRKRIDCHFYDSGGISEDTDNLVPTAVRSRSEEEHDIPSTPHPQHSTLYSDRRERYPHKTHGPYCRIQLAKHDVDTISALDIYDDAGDSEDWVAASDKTQGDDYRLYVEPGGAPSTSYVDILATSLPHIHHYDGAVRVSYDYGQNSLPGTIRRAVALRAAAELVDEPAFSIPENAQVRGVDSLASEMNDRAEELLKEYR